MWSYWPAGDHMSLLRTICPWIPAGFSVLHALIRDSGSLPGYQTSCGGSGFPLLLPVPEETLLFGKSLKVLNPVIHPILGPHIGLTSLKIESCLFPESLRQES